jgi:Tfp pilus assembly protein PilN
MAAKPINAYRQFRRLLAFGSGVGIEIHGKDLHVVVTRVRPTGVRVLGYCAIANFTGRPASEWGSLYAKFLKGLGAAHLSATVLIPRDQVIVRQLTLPGVKANDMEGAIRFQLDTLHPYGEEDVEWGWSPLPGDAALVGIMRREAMERYATLFAEAGVPVHSFTFSAAAIHTAIQLNATEPPEAFVAVGRSEDGEVEIYGQSPARPVFSAQFDMPAERAAVLAASELRVETSPKPMPLAGVLPAPRLNPVENDLARNALPYAAALAGSCPMVASAANLLPVSRRVSTSRTLFIPTMALAAILALVAGGMLVWSAIDRRQYLKRLEAETERLKPQDRKAAALDRQFEAVRARIRQLDEFRGRTRADLDALNELTRLLAPPVWTNGIDLTRENVTLSGEAPQASGLIKIIDASPFFENSDFSVIAKSQNAEMFRIRANRRGRK